MYLFIQLYWGRFNTQDELKIFAQEHFIHDIVKTSIIQLPPLDQYSFMIHLGFSTFGGHCGGQGGCNFHTFPIGFLHFWVVFYPFIIPINSLVDPIITSISHPLHMSSYWWMKTYVCFSPQSSRNLTSSLITSNINR
jgi:hypothetical protein